MSSSGLNSSSACTSLSSSSMLGVTGGLTTGTADSTSASSIPSKATVGTVASIAPHQMHHHTAPAALFVNQLQQPPGANDVDMEMDMAPQPMQPMQQQPSTPQQHQHSGGINNFQLLPQAANQQPALPQQRTSVSLQTHSHSGSGGRPSASQQLHVRQHHHKSSSGYHHRASANAAPLASTSTGSGASLASGEVLLQPYFGGGPGTSSSRAALIGLDVGLNSPAESMAPLSPCPSSMADSPSEVSTHGFWWDLDTRSRSHDRRLAFFGFCCRLITIFFTYVTEIMYLLISVLYLNL